MNSTTLKNNNQDANKWGLNCSKNCAGEYNPQSHLCSQCNADHYQLSSYKCEACPKDTSLVTSLSIVVIIPLMAVVFVLFLHLRIPVLILESNWRCYSNVVI